VRRPPRGVQKTRYAADNWYDVWLPNLAPSDALLKQVHGSLSWSAFEKKYRLELKRPEQAHLLTMLAALSQQTNFAVGCYCEEESQCHRSILRKLLEEHGAKVV
jgi:uncharacterized protein YeaO (DUF488 family)